MGYIVSLGVVIVYSISLLILKTDQLMFGYNYMIEFVFVILQFALDKPITFPYYEYSLVEIENLRSGYIFHFFFFVLFVCVSVFFRIFNPEDSEKEMKMKKMLGSVVFVFALISMFAGANNYSEYNRQLKLFSSSIQLEVEDLEESLVIDNVLVVNNVYQHGAVFDKENKRVLVNSEKYKIELIKLNKNSDYGQLVKKRYSYNLRSFKEKETNFKNRQTTVVEYFTNEDYNRDYVIRVNEDIFVLRFQSYEGKSQEAIDLYKNFLIYSINLKEG